MHGNVWEWCEYGRDMGFRGGAWFHPASSARSAARNTAYVGNRYPFVGMRSAKSIPSS
jgi:formylglycine-generating enzyme required for sulfatase activity